MSVNFSLRTKLLILTLSVVVCFGGAICFYVVMVVANGFTTELLKRGTSIARHIAESSAEAFIENDHVRLHYLAQSHQATEADIRYVLMTDSAGEPLGHSFGSSFPVELIAANRYDSSREAVIKRLDTGTEVLYDIAVPVLDGRIGSVRVGLSAEPVSNVSSRFIKNTLVAVLLIGLLVFAVTVPAAQAIARPLAELTRAIDGLSKGHRDLRLPVERRDEIGTLIDTFNQMTVAVSKAEKRLAAQVNFLRVLMEGLPLPVFYKDRSLRMLGCNEAFAAFWGKRPDEIIGRAAEELYAPEAAALHRAKDEEVLRTEQPLTYEYTVASADGARHDVVFHKALFRDEDAQPAGIIGVMHDVTQQRKVDRMKSEFVSTVAHEFQTPLATILGFSELLHDGALDEPERKDALQLIIHKSEILSQMVDELLDLARMESGHPLKIDREPCDLGQLLAESLDSFRLRIATHHFILDLPEVPVVIRADGKRIAQVVDNLLSNAVKYSGVASTIRVGAGISQGVCRLTVRDEGMGMSSDQLEHLFDKFYRANTTNTAPAGTGLGLFITKAIVDAHQGQIRIDSKPGEGTTVTVELPVGDMV